MYVCSHILLLKRPENAVTYLAGNGGQTVCWGFSETAPLQRSSTPGPAIRTVGNFPAESAHAQNALALSFGGLQPQSPPASVAYVTDLLMCTSDAYSIL